MHMDHMQGANVDAPNTHNMLVVGERAVFLSHLPMFDGVNKSKTEFVSPHRFQVILEATFAKQGRDVQEIYTKDRRANPSTKMYTLNPDEFVLQQLFAPDPKQPALRSFTGTVFRGHLERGGKPIEGLRDVTVTIKRVVYARKFDPRAAKSPQLEYILFGRGRERFLAHLITVPPDYDQILSLTVSGREFTDDELSHGVRVHIPDRRASPGERLKQGEQAPGEIQALGAVGAQSARLQLRAGVELYFEEGELRVPPTFEQTAEERRAGF